MQFRVAKGGSILGIDNVLYGGGEILPEKAYNTKTIEEHIKSGFARVVGAKDLSIAAGQEGYTPDQAPGIDVKKIPVIPGKDKNEGITTIDSTTGIKTSTSTNPAAPKPPVSQKGKWDIDPATLADKDLPWLNVKAQEIEPGIKPFGDVQEGVAWLSQDFVPKQ